METRIARATQARVWGGGAGSMRAMVGAREGELKGRERERGDEEERKKKEEKERKDERVGRRGLRGRVDKCWDQEDIFLFILE